jgi:hypothetical protein
MKMAQLLGALLACAPLAFAAGAPASPEHSASSAAPSTKATRAVDGVAPASSEKGHGPKTGLSESGVAPRASAVNPRRAAGQVTHGRADQFHSLSGAQTRGRVAQPSHPYGPTRAAAVGGPSVRGSHGMGSHGMSPAGAPKPAATAKSPTTNTTGRAGATLGGPHAQGYGHLGGQAIGRTTHNTSIDGSLLHRKFAH